MSDGAPSSRQHASPARSAAIIGKLGPCPPFDASLTNEQIKPYILKVLETTQQSRSPLHLSKTLWPEASTDLRHSMKVRVSQPLHALSKVVKHASEMLQTQAEPAMLASHIHTTCNDPHKIQCTAAVQKITTLGMSVCICSLKAVCNIHGTLLATVAIHMSTSIQLSRRQHCIKQDADMQVNSALYSLQCDGRAIKNSVDWSLAPSRMA